MQARRSTEVPVRHGEPFGHWLALGNCEVVVPFARVLARLIPPRSVRLRRDFTQMVSAIKAHALLHREHRYKTEEDGEIVATIEGDYAVVRELMRSWPRRRRPR